MTRTQIVLSEFLDKLDRRMSCTSIEQALIALDTCDCALYQVERTFHTQNIALLERDAETGKMFFEIPFRSLGGVRPDVVSGIHSDIDIDVVVGGDVVRANEQSLMVPLVSTMYTEVVVRFWFPHDQIPTTFSLGYTAMYLASHHRQQLMNACVLTPEWVFVEGSSQKR